MTSPIIIAVPSAASPDAFIIDAPPENVMFYLDYYLLLLGAITILCWGLAIQFASPLNQLAETVRRFGVGDLSARVHSRRHDGIGDVARALIRWRTGWRNSLQPSGGSCRTFPTSCVLL